MMNLEIVHGFGRRWRTASNRQTPVATETLRHSTLPAIGRAAILFIATSAISKENDRSALKIEITTEKTIQQQEMSIPQLDLQIGDNEKRIEVARSTPRNIEIFSVKITCPSADATMVSFGYCSSSDYQAVQTIEGKGVDLGHKVRHGTTGIADDLHYICHRVGDDEALTILVSLDPSMRIVASWRAPAVETPLGSNHARLEAVGNNQYRWVISD